MPSYISTSDAQIVAPVVADRYPIHLGSNGTVAAITSILRLAETGYRLQFCDVLNELIEGDPHATSVINIRCQAVSGRPWTIKPPALDNESEQAQAQVIADFVDSAIRAIPNWRQHVNAMLRGIIYGVTAREIMWRRGPRGELLIDHLEFIHSRRLAYGWDFKLVWTIYGQSNEGHALEDYPHKFFVFEPMLGDEYPTRDGIGRVLAYWLAFKRFSVRDFLGFVERFGKPYPDVTWRKGDDTQPADDDDITIAQTLAKRYGTGSMAGVAHPDTVNVELRGNGSNNSGSGGSGESTPHKALIALVDEQVSKLVIGQAYTTNGGQKTGLGNSGDPFESQSRLIYVSDAAQMESAIDQSIIRSLVVLNFGEDMAAKYLPHYSIEIEDQEDESTLMARIDQAVRLGYPLQTAWMAERFDWPLPEEGDEVLAASGLPRAYSVPEIGDELEQQGLGPNKGGDEDEKKPEKGKDEPKKGKE
jgi:phage gp29-like protein